MPFNPSKDKIAITVPFFTLKKAAISNPLEIFTDLYHNEPYLITLAIDSQGTKQQSLNFNFAEFPNTLPGDTVRMLGDGHMVYGPKNPGDFVAVSILVMESDRDTRQLGGQIEAIVNHKATEIGLQTIMAAHPTAAILVPILEQLAKLIAVQLKEDQDDPLFRFSGVFLRDSNTPYSINRQFESGNEFVDLAVKVIPLKSHNGQGPAVRSIQLD